MIEKEIILIGVRKIHSDKKQKDFYIIDYIEDKIPRTEFTTIEAYNKVASKQKDFLQKCVGLFTIDNFRNIKLADIK